ncbi:hypothetical protein DMB65_07960 [Flavobacterium cheongpyeongense]|uniref:Uncharacterized protein n=1 Tax=Flavobacterium cheongpyeongense TaxID=2212651 RepID=A0A2V4BQM4_9FLAO|nr:hypothetical protein [Flavobacterium cheongpyeongense]PXY41328.1 hypothetical protein DMB65_07960 [Flavobacterium cheongpyeongense]
MNELLITKQIQETLLKIVSHEDNPVIVFIYIDTSTDENREIVPFLNIYASLIFDGANFDEAIKNAVDNCNSGYIEDVLQDIDSSSFEINLSVFYPDWPDEVEIGDQKILNILNLFVNKNQDKFNLIEKLYFDYVDNFDFVKIIDKSNTKN